MVGTEGEAPTPLRSMSSDNNCLGRIIAHFLAIVSHSLRIISHYPTTCGKAAGLRILLMKYLLLGL